MGWGRMEYLHIMDAIYQMDTVNGVYISMKGENREMIWEIQIFTNTYLFRENYQSLLKSPRVMS